MNSIHMRGAVLDDTQAISTLFRNQISVWQRFSASGRVEDVPYEALTIYERWLHGGPWMSVETAAIHLSHLLRGAGIPLVVEAEGKIAAYAEAYRGVEPEPYGSHIHVAQIMVHPDFSYAGLQDLILNDVMEQARIARLSRVTANCLASDSQTQSLYTQHGMTPISRIRRYNLPAKSGQGFYKVVEHPADNPQQINNWFMPVGRLGSSHQQWETFWPQTWHAIAEIRERRTHRLQFSASGQEALIYCQQQLYNPRAVEVFMWSPKPLTTQLLTALRDWTHREGYRTLVLSVNDDTAKVFGTEAEADGYFEDVYGVSI
ncbi:MAG: GNAT family N-acetyltransferase [Chloroflexi bacterium]|nr:GNAT family N-acetyltransferase [Chloroflexota bacterium]MCC6895725.1 GNAT family N-acetyltransferase [Anaerolineae bacterium]